MTRLLRPRVLAMGAAVMLLAFPAAAGAASLKLTITPGKVKPGQKYVIKATGRFTKAEVHGTAYLWEFIQYSPAACQPTGQAEDSLAPSLLSPFGGKEKGSPFTRTDEWKAGTTTGRRRVCAYLYPQVVSARSRVKPIATAEAAYRNT